MTEKQETTRDLVVAQPDSRTLAERGATSLIARGGELAVQLRGMVNTRALSPPQTTTVTLPGGVVLDMVLVPAGSFTMGSNEETNEQPMHTVAITQPFVMGKYQVTQAQWQAVMGANPSGFASDLNRPVDTVSWDDCQEFIRTLNALGKSKLRNLIEKLNVLGKGTFRLPSEAEWEYAYRAGSDTRWYFDNDETQLVNYAWYYVDLADTTHPVGQKLPNAFGLHDMSGNVWEWCQDSWHHNYCGAPVNGSAWDHPGSSARVLRGGDWGDFSTFCRAAYRRISAPDSRYNSFGVRLVRTL
jgi:formylglycine-generating enzyme required for sulfatase activity